MIDLNVGDRAWVCGYGYLKVADVHFFHQPRTSWAGLKGYGMVVTLDVDRHDTVAFTDTGIMILKTWYGISESEPPQQLLFRSRWSALVYWIKDFVKNLFDTNSQAINMAQSTRRY